MPCLHAPEPSRDVGRRALALWAVLLWVLGFEVGPGLHLGWHAALGDHEHRPVAQHEHDDDHDHDHDHGHDHDHDHDAGDVDVVVTPLQHGEHDVAHRGIAVLVPPVAMPVVADAAWRDIVDVEVSLRLICDLSPLHTRARGPPHDAWCRLVNCVA